MGPQANAGVAQAVRDRRGVRSRRRHRQQRSPRAARGDRRLSPRGGLHHRADARGRVVRHLRLDHRDSRQARAPPSARLRRCRGERRGTSARQLGKAEERGAEKGEQGRALRCPGGASRAIEGCAADGEGGTRRIRLARHRRGVPQSR